MKGVLAVNGMMVDLSGNQPTIAEYIETGRTYLDGTVQIGALDGVVRDRIRMALNGHVVVTLIVDEEDEPLGDPWCDIKGLPETGRSRAALVDILEADLGQWLARAEPKTLRNDDKLQEGLDRAADCSGRTWQETRGDCCGQSAQLEPRALIANASSRVRARPPYPQDPLLISCMRTEVASAMA